ncbi:MAG: DUF4831 family protein [Alistipes sp.]|nr:DUF4831 family protein [Alistipes sp.]
MKRLLMLVALLFSAATLMAQNNPYIALVGVVDTANGVALSAPTTTLTVDIEAECERTICGPYARYAQKLLGVRAPLTDKMEWRVKRAAIGLADASSFVQQPFEAAPAKSMNYADAEEGFSMIQPDKSSTSATTLEDAALMAANSIFSLRRHRTELITGEAGEHVFGEGLKSALEEIARQEQALLELFLGKRTVRSEVRRFVLSPESTKQQYVVCRLSAVDGIVPSSDLTGDMVVLQITPAETVESPVPEAGVKETMTVSAMVANRAACSIQVRGEEVAREVLPLFQFGRMIQLAQPKRR